MRPFILIVLTCLAAIALTVAPVTAMSPFKKAFDETYVKPSGDKEFQTAFKKLSCNTCHVKGKKKDWLNAYGQELANLIPGSAKERLDQAKEIGTEERAAETEKLRKELTSALEKVAAMKAPSGETYDELFKAHKLPTPDGAKSVKEEKTTP